MVNEINLVSLGNTNIQFIDGDRGKNYPQKTDFYKNGYCVFLNTGNVKPDGFDFSDLYYITQEKDEILNKGRVQLNDIVLTTRGTVGNVAIFDDQVPFKKIRINSGMVIIRCSNRFYPYFLYSFFRSSLFKSQCGLNGSGSAQPQLPISAIKNIKIPEFNLKTQQSIAAVLSALDKKIALNKQINTRLEEMAKTLYDYWFVQFDFPDANGKPYKSSGGEMVFDETLKREIPKGWEVKSLGEIALTSSGGTPTSTVQEYYKGGNIPWINSGELNNNFIVYTDNFITQTGMDNSSAKLVSEKSILLAMYGATAGKTSLISFKTTTNQAICSILPKDMNYRVYIKSYLDNMYLYLVQLSSGSARDNLSQDKIKRLHLVIPESGILEIFSNVTEDFYKKIENNLKQNYHLTQIRDFLLPMLMNGQVSVAE